jgi:hypothetical protein
VATRGGNRRTGSNDRGQPVINLPLRISPFHHIEVPVAKVTNRRHTSGELPPKRLDDHRVDLFRRVLRKPLQRHHPVVADEVHMRVDQPRKHSRIAVVEQLTVGWWLVPHRLNPDNAAILHQHRRATGPEIFTIECAICTDRKHTAWLLDQPAPVNAFPTQGTSIRHLSFDCETTSDQPVDRGGARHARRHQGP